MAGLQQTDEMIQNEIFGPVITVQPFTDEDYTHVKHVMASLS